MSSRAWITRLAVAGVVGSGGAAFAGMSIDNPVSMPGELAAAAISDTSTSLATVAPSTDTTVTYQVGPAGSVGLTRTGDVLTVTSVTAGEGWTTLGASAPSSHVTVQFSDSLQVVTFIADAVGDDVAVAVENLPTGTVATVPNTAAGSSPSAGSRPAPATPAAVVTPATPATHTSSTMPAPVTTQSAPQVTTPTSASTTAPSSGGDDDEYDNEDHHDDEEGEDD